MLLPPSLPYLLHWLCPLNSYGTLLVPFLKSAIPLYQSGFWPVLCLLWSEKCRHSSVTTAYWFPLCAATVCTAVSKAAWVGIVLRHIGTYRTLRMQVPVLRTMKENNRELWERLIMGQLYFRQQEGKGSIPWGRDFVKEMRGMRRTLPD